MSMRDLARLVLGVAQGQDSFAFRPGGPAVDLALGRVAADPVGVHEHVGVVAGPVAASAKASQVLASSSDGVRYSSWQFVPLAKNARMSSTMRSVSSGSPWLANMTPWVIRELIGYRGARQHDVLIGLGVAIGDLLLPLRAPAAGAPIVARAPGRIRVPQPVGGGPRAGRDVDEQVGFSLAEIADQPQQGLDVRLRTRPPRRSELRRS